MHIASDEQTVNKLWTNYERLKSVFSARIHYIYNAPRVQRLLLKFFNVSLYAIIISNLYDFVKYLRNWLFSRIWRIAQIPNVWYIPNVRIIPDNPAAGFFAVVPIFQPKKVDVCLILSRQKVEGYRLYCASEKLTAIAPSEEWNIYIYI